MPLIFYAPGKQLDLVSEDQVTQQVDILPTVIDLVAGHEAGSAISRARFGSSLVAKEAKRIAHVYGDDSHWLVKGSHALRWSVATNAFSASDWLADPLAEKNVELPAAEYQDLESELKARLTYYTLGMRLGRLNWPPEGLSN